MYTKNMPIEAVIRNRLTRIIYPFPEEMPAYFSYLTHNYRFKPAYKSGGWDGTKCLLRGSKVSTGLFLALKDKIAKDGGFEWDLFDYREPCQFHEGPVEGPDGFEIRPYQRESVEAMMANSKTGGILLNATGTGKTVIAGLYFRKLIGSGVFIVDELTLLDQAKSAIESVIEEPVGIIGKGIFEPKRVTVATVQTLGLHQDKELYRAWGATLETAIVDELHDMLNKRQEGVLNTFRPKAVFGITATLDMRKEHIRYEALALCGDVIYTYKYDQGVKDGYLTQGVVIGADMVRASRISATDLEELEPKAIHRICYDAQIVEDIQRSTRTAEIAREAVKRGYSVILLAERLAHLNYLSDELSDVPHQIVWGGRNASERKSLKTRFEAEKIRLLIANKVFKKGIDIKVLNLIIDAAGGASANDAIQKFGRGVRMTSGKQGLIYIDIGERSGTLGKNYLSGATKTRRKALKTLKVPIIEMRLKEGACAILDAAERAVSRIKPKQSKLF